MLEDRLEERDEVVVGVGRVVARDPLAGDGVEHGEVELLVVRRQLQEEILRPGVDLLDTRVAPVDLVDDQNRLEAQFQRLLEDEAGLRHRPLDGVHQQQAAVRHVEHALDLAAEVGVPRRIDDVDLDAAIDDGGVLGEDGDAALALQLVGVHDQLADLLVLAEDLALLEQTVHQSGLAVVDVGDDGDVTNVVTNTLRARLFAGGGRLQMWCCFFHGLHQFLSI